MRLPVDPSLRPCSYPCALTATHMQLNFKIEKSQKTSSLFCKGQWAKESPLELVERLPGESYIINLDIMLSAILDDGGWSEDTKYK